MWQPTSDHNEPLAGDTLYTVRFNSEWRPVVVEILERAFNRLAIGVTDETEQDTFNARIEAMIEDFYTEEVSVVSDFAIGDLKTIPHDTIPSDWLLCDGSAISRATYSTLFSLIGTDYGIGDGSTTFNLPDLRGRVVVGSGTGSGLSNRVLAATVGAETHQLSIAELPSDFPKLRMKNNTGSPTATHVASANSGTDDFNSSNAVSNQGSNTPHNNMQPSLVLNYIIKVQ